MSIGQTDLKALLQKSGNRCAFPNCGEVLLQEGSDLSDPVILSKIAHIVARSEDGPRGKYPLPMAERDKESNLMLLCGKHHDIIDNMPQMYTVERLRQIKEDHEALMLAATGEAIIKRGNDSPTRKVYVHDTLFSTLFQVTTFPQYVYAATFAYTDTQKSEIQKNIVTPEDRTEIYPYIIQAGELYTFQDLGRRTGPFSKVIDMKTARPITVQEWYNDAVKSRWLTMLLNHSLNKLTGRKGLNWDKDHDRYYFQPDERGKVKETLYRPLNVATASKQVVWQPISKRTGEPRPYWLHRAANLKFHRVTATQWCLTIRPEFRVTKDGYISEEPKKIGSRVTRKKSRMFNYDLLGEVNFWRDFLSDGQPRIILNFGRNQLLIVSTTMMQAEADWPGIPEEYAKPFRNVEYQEDLFSFAELERLTTNMRENTDIDEVDIDEAEDDWIEDDDE